MKRLPLIALWWLLALCGVAGAQVCAGPNYTGGTGIQINLSKIGTQNVPTGSINAKTDEGAKGDCSTYDTPALQKSITDANTNAGSGGNTVVTNDVFWPSTPNSCYLTDFPIWIKTNANNGSALHLHGAGNFATQVKASGAYPVLFVAPSTYTTGMNAGAGAGVLWQAPLVGATGQSMLFNPNDNASWMLDAKAPFVSNSSKPYDGLAAFSVQWFGDIADTSNGDNGYFFSSRFGGDNYHAVGGNNSGLFSVYYTIASAGAANTLACYFRTSAGLSQLFSLGTFTSNAVHFFEMSYDGTNIRFFIDGVETNKTAKTGTTADPTYDNFLIGAYSYWPFYTPGLSPVGSMFSVRVSNTARHTTDSTYTPPTSAQAGDSNTLLLVNGTTVNSAKSTSSVAGPFVQPEYVGGSANSTAWIPMHTQDDQAEALQSVNVEGIQTYGGSIGLWDIFTIDSSFRDMTFLYPNYVGVAQLSDTWDTSFYNIDSEVAVPGLTPYAFLWGSATTCYNCHQDGGAGEYAVIDTGNMTYINPFFQMNSGTQVGLVSKPDNSANHGIASTEEFFNGGFDDENGSTGPILTLGTGIQATFDQTELIFGTTTPPIYVPGGTSGVTNIIFDGGGFSWSSAPAALVGNVNGTASKNAHIRFNTQFDGQTGITNPVPLVANSGLDYAVESSSLTVAGTTAGSFAWGIPTYTTLVKRVVVDFTGYENTTGAPQTVTLPEGGFTAFGALITDSGSCTQNSSTLAISSTTITLPSSMNGTLTGQCEFVGY